MKVFFRILLLGLALMTGCSRFTTDDDGRIGLSISIGNLDIESKVATADAYDETMMSAENPFETAMWFSLDENSFRNTPDAFTSLPCYTTMNFANTGITYASYKPSDGAERDLKYPIPVSGEAAPVYCVGFHPSTGWTGSSDGVNATRAITGSDDIMFAPKISGNWIERFGPQTYQHQLTWLKINVCATTVEAGKQWGNIAKVEVMSDEYINIDLSDGTGKVSYINPTTDDYYITTYENTAVGAENDPSNQLTLTSTEVGSVFCSPETSYNIRLTMFSGVVKTITIPLKDLSGNFLTSESQAKGKLFVINLYFQPFAIVEGTSMLYYWNNKNEDLLPE